MWWRRLRLRHVKRPITGAIHGLDLLKCRMKAGQIDRVGKKGDGPHVWVKLAPERREPAARREGLYTLFSPCKAQQCVTHMCDSRFSGGSSSTAGDVVTGSLAPRSRPQELHTRISAQSSCTRVSSLPISSTCFQKERVASDGSRIHKHSGRHTPSFTARLAGTKGLPDIIAVALSPRGLARASRIAKRRISISHPVEPQQLLSSPLLGARYDISLPHTARDRFRHSIVQRCQAMVVSMTSSLFTLPFARPPYCRSFVASCP